jgi:hypothetical protein
VANPNPTNFNFGPLGTIYVTGALSGLGFWQSNPFPGDRNERADLSNGQIVIQKTDGIFQFYVQGGIYSLPSLGASYLSAERQTGDTFGVVPEAYAKLVPSDSFNVEAGKLPTLIGAEYAFTFENMNIERGLLWNQEPIISRGVQVNLTTGPVAWSASINDGFYSGQVDWATGAATWTINPANSLEIVGGGNYGRATTIRDSLLPVLPQDNGQILNVIYTYNSAPWTITPYFQYTNVPSNPTLGWTHSGQTWAGALLASYAFNGNVSLAGRAEIIGSTGSITDGAPNLLYGPGSSAWSFTLTPTYQQGIFFARAEGSIVGASGITPGLAFGRNGSEKTQGRVMLEAGVIF